MNLLYFIILIPLISFLLLSLIGKRWRRENNIVIGISGVGLIGILTIFVCIDFFINTKADTSLIYTRYLWEWLTVQNFSISITLLLDGLSLVFLIIVAIVGLIIHSYAATSIGRNETYVFFAYGNLLIANILIVILVDNLFVMLLGWEGISICSYLLIGFYNKRLKSSYAAIRTFVIMHIGDIFLFIGICLIYSELGTLNMRQVVSLATDKLAVDSEIIYWITLFLFLGAIGKSAQLPLHIWLTDTASAPTPALTLIHSASAILSGIYLIVRLNGLFMLSNDTLWLIGIIASLTLLFSACSALVQNDIKRMTTYMSLSQICYVFLAISVEAWNEALAYLMNYTAFTTLLFLASSTLMQIYHGERNIHKITIKIRRYPFLYGCFMVAAASISVIPWVTATFYTKGNILWATASQGKIGFGAIGLVGILLNTMGIFRVMFVIFHRKTRKIPPQEASDKFKFNYFALGILALLSLCFYSQIPLPTVGLLPSLSLPDSGLFSFRLLLSAITILGILITYILFATNNSEIDEIADSPIGKILHRLWYTGWRIERVYYLLFIRPYLYITGRLQRDPLMQWMNYIPSSINKINLRIAGIENGHLRWYIASIVVGAVGIFLLLVFV